MLQLRDQYRVASYHRLDLRCSITAMLDMHNPGRRSKRLRKGEEIRVRGDDGVLVDAGVLPDRLIGCKLGQFCLENMNGLGEEFGKAAYKLGRKIRVKQQLQRDMRSRPNCAAYA